MFGPFLEAAEWCREKLPGPRQIFKRLTRPFQPGKKFEFHFITWHYAYLLFLIILGSVLLFPFSEMTYIDALFFSSGAATQSGLNTIDINLLKLEQQVVLMLMACIANPIFIHGSLVFLRLYWFEKRFQNIVQDARNLRRTRTGTRTRSQARASEDVERDAHGVNGREIRVLRREDGQAEGKAMKDGIDGMMEKENSTAIAESSSSEDQPMNGKTSQEGDPMELFSTPPASAGARSPALDQTPTADQTPGGFHRDIMFADEVRRNRPWLQTPENGSPAQNSASPIQRLPDRLSAEHHIAFVENQRNRSNTGTLRIPGPRDFDRGDVPRRIDADSSRPISAVASPISPGLTRTRVGENDEEELNDDDHPYKQNHTTETPRPLSRLRQGVANHLHIGRSHTEAEGERSGLRHRARTFASIATARTQDKDDPMPYLSWAPTMGRNSAFVDLSEEQREELGGIEYRALKTLAWILVIYFVGFHVLGMVCQLPWILYNPGRSEFLKEYGISPSWWGVFAPASSFNDLGFTLTPDSMISFQTAVWPLILGSFLIIIGNTGFPCMLRFVIWVAACLVPKGSAIWEELRFLLDHPRRCFTLLFPSGATWWLFWVLVILNGTDLIFFIILDLNDSTVTSLAPGIRVLDGWYQAASTRTAGFSVVNLAELHPAIQVSYLIMMYISVFPIAISVRRTNVYEEKSLGIYASEDAEETPDTKSPSYVGFHLRRQLSFDLWFVFLGFFFIAIIEGSRLQNTNEYAFSLFSVLFEIISAYGTVGLSLGFPGTNTSFSAQFKVLSKLIIIAMMIRGRHRGLPYALDRAILLPSEGLKKKEEDHDAWRRARRNSAASQHPPVGLPSDFNFGGATLGRMPTGGTGISTGPTGVGGAVGPGARRGSVSSEIGPRISKTRTGTSRFGEFLSGALSAGPTMSHGEGLKRS